MLNHTLKNLGFEGLDWIESATMYTTCSLLSHDSLNTNKCGDVIINYKLLKSEGYDLFKFLVGLSIWKYQRELHRNYKSLPPNTITVYVVNNKILKTYP
jgi:hypothetical protein